MTGFYFKYSSNVHFENITISGCSMVLFSHVRAALAFDVVQNLSIIQVNVNNSVGFGLYASNVFGSVTISRSLFSFNRGDDEWYGGNVRFWYKHCPFNPEIQLNISNSWFMHGFDTKKKTTFYPYASGLALFIYCPSVSVYITNSTAINNTAENGGNIAIKLNFTAYGKAIGSVVMRDCYIGQGIGHRGGGLRIWSIAQPLESKESNYYKNTTNVITVTTLEVINTCFIGNHANAAGGALYISNYEHDKINLFTHKLIFTNCTFSKNSVPAYGNGGVAEIIKHKIIGHKSRVLPQFETIFVSCNFTENWIILDDIEITHGAIMDIFSINKVYFQSCHFINNNSTTISAVGSNIIFSGELTFENNTAVNGGALKFCDTSVMYIENNTNILFIRNRAKFFGGAIYAQQRCLETANPCFFQPDVHDFTKVYSIEQVIKLEFVGNKAGISGDALYGGSIDMCYTYQHFVLDHKSSYYYSSSVFNSISDISQQNGSVISSDPYGVCLCYPNPLIKNCTIKELLIYDVYAGKEFSIFAVPIGQRHGVAPAIVLGEVVDQINNVSLKPDKGNLLSPARECKELKYTINSNIPTVSFNLTAQTTTFYENSFYYKFEPPQVIVQLQPCPWGYKHENNHDGKKYCACHYYLQKSGDIECSTKYQTVTRKGTVWIGSDFNFMNQSQQNLQFSLDLLISEYCPYNYCKLQSINLTNDTTDTQCDYNRTGILCGACDKGLSVILGGPECFSCTNTSLLLVPVFAVMGIALVIFLSLINLTVTQGTINGIIFYVNVIQINRAVYFPSGTLPLPIDILLGIISWLNLDFGVRTCFYNGMDTFTKVILQFIFPVYIWLVVIIVIFLSRRYTLPQRLIGINAIKVLATLFLLSFAKLGRTIIMSLSYIIISSSSGQSYEVWLPDGNLPFLKGKQILVFTLGLSFLILLFLYTCLVTLIPWIQRAPYKAPFSYIIRLKPLLDAYTGPLKNKYRFWTGFLLFIRIILYTLLALNDLNNHRVKLYLTASTTFFILFLQSSFQGVYENWKLDALEASFFFNLGILSISSCFIQSMHEKNKAVFSILISSLSISIALLEFFSIVLYHCYVAVQKSLILKTWWASLTEPASRQEIELPRRLLFTDNDTMTGSGHSTISQTEIVVTPTEGNTPALLCEQMPPFVDFSLPREPLLEDN